MVSGGSSASWSATLAATTVTVHDSLLAKSPVGSRVNVVGPPLVAAACEPLDAQLIVNQLPVTSTGSLKVIVTFEPTATPEAPADGVVDEIFGASSAVPCGLGAPISKSAALLFVSWTPPLLR